MSLLFDIFSSKRRTNRVARVLATNQGTRRSKRDARAIKKAGEVANFWTVLKETTGLTPLDFQFIP